MFGGAWTNPEEPLQATIAAAFIAALSLVIPLWIFHTDPQYFGVFFSVRSRHVLTTLPSQGKRGQAETIPSEPLVETSSHFLPVALSPYYCSWTSGLVPRHTSHLSIWSCYLILSQYYHFHHLPSPSISPLLRTLGLHLIFVKDVSVLHSICISSVPRTASCHKSAGTSDRGRGISGHLPEIPEERGTGFLLHLKVILQILKVILIADLPFFF